MKKTNSKNIYLILLLTGFISTVSIALENHFSLSELAWFFWAANLIASPFILVGTQVEHLIRGEGSAVSRSLKSVLTFAAGLGILYFVSGVTGAFLSVFAEISPDYYFGRNGYVNNFEPVAVYLLFKKYFLLFPGYLLGKSFLLMETTMMRTKVPGVAKDAVLSIILCLMAKLIFRTNEEASVIFFCALFFFPWKLIVSKDIGGKKIDREADLDPEIKIPTDFVDQGPLFWGIVMALFGLIFVIVGSAVPIFIMMKDGQIISRVLVGGVFFLAFVGFGLLAIFMGLNMGLGYKKIRIEAGIVKCEKRFFAPLLKIDRWEVPLSVYRLDSRTIPWDSDGIRLDQYVVELIHPTDKDKMVTLYRAYHSEDLFSRKEKWQSVLGLNEGPSSLTIYS